MRESTTWSLAHGYNFDNRRCRFLPIIAEYGSAISAIVYCIVTVASSADFALEKHEVGKYNSFSRRLTT